MRGARVDSCSSVIGRVLVADATGKTSTFKAKLKKKKDTFIKSIRKSRLLNIHENNYLSLIKVRRNLLPVHELSTEVRNQRSCILLIFNCHRCFRAASNNIQWCEVSHYSEQISVARRPLLSNSSVKPNFNGSVMRCV